MLIFSYFLTLMYITGCE